MLNTDLIIPNHERRYTGIPTSELQVAFINNNTVELLWNLGLIYFIFSLRQ